MRKALTVLARSYPRLSKVTIAPREVVQGKQRLEFDQPARKFKYFEQLYALNDDERETILSEPVIGVDHLYEAHLGSKERPVIVEQMGVHGQDITVGCLGACHPDATELGPIYMVVPQNALCVCADCGLHFVAVNNEEVTFWPDGTQPIDKIPFKLVEDLLYKHIRYGSPLLL
eukprot:RCo006348